jgi:hypothetical protein
MLSIERAKVMRETSNADRVQTVIASFLTASMAKIHRSRDMIHPSVVQHGLIHLNRKSYEPVLNFNNSVSFLARLYSIIPRVFSLAKSIQKTMHFSE